MPIKNANLFVGSSSIRLWKTIGSDFDGYPIINRGFGGSNLIDLEAFTDRIIIKYSPAKIFIYSGENDLAEGIAPEEVLHRFEKVFLKIREKLPQVPIVFISLKPSIARVRQLPAQKITNQLIYNYLEKQTKTQFVNIMGKMSLKGKPNPSLFITDKLHMNRRGYEIWIKKLKKYLVK
ncbi:MAG: GDSL-type esterase/lipase family protein [Bacteroidota bacterium]